MAEPQPQFTHVQSNAPIDRWLVPGVTLNTDQDVVFGGAAEAPVSNEAQVSFTGTGRPVTNGGG